LQLRRIDPVSTFKTSFVLYCFLGLFAAVLLIVFGLLGWSESSGAGQGGGFAPGMLEIVLLAVFVPIVYGLVGAVGLWLLAILYNWVAGWAGGIEVELS